MALSKAMAKYLREYPGARFEQFAAEVEAGLAPVAVYQEWRGQEKALKQNSRERCLFEAARVTEIRETAEAVDAVLAGPAFGLEHEARYPRNSDALDFREIGIWTLREALAEAYRAGFVAGSAAK